MLEPSGYIYDIVISEFFFLSKSGDFGALISQESFLWVLLSLSLYINIFVAKWWKFTRNKNAAEEHSSKYETKWKKLHISHNSQRNMTLLNIPLKMWDQMKTTTSFCVSLLNGESKQTNWFFFQFGAWIHSKEEDGKGWDERMHEWMKYVTWVMGGCKLLGFHPHHLDERMGWMQIVSFSSTPFGWKNGVDEKLGIVTWISEGEDSISDGKFLISERDYEWGLWTSFHSP